MYKVCKSPSVGFKVFIPPYQERYGPYNSHRRELPLGGAAELGIPMDDEDALHEADIVEALRLVPPIRGILIQRELRIDTVMIKNLLRMLQVILKFDQIVMQIPFENECVR